MKIEDKTYSRRGEAGISLENCAIASFPSNFSCEPSTDFVNLPGSVGAIGM